MVVAGSFADSLLCIKLIEAVISFYLRVLRFWLPGIAMLLPLHMPVRYNDTILRNFDLKIIVQIIILYRCMQVLPRRRTELSFVIFYRGDTDYFNYFTYYLSYRGYANFHFNFGPNFAGNFSVLRLLCTQVIYRKNNSSFLTRTIIVI